jgi:hypothetical protein
VGPGNAEQAVEQFRLFEQGCRRAAVHHIAVIEHHGTVADGQDGLRVLLHDDGRQAFFARDAAMARSSSSTMMGARPSSGSSSSNSRGLSTSARPTASICCSPPDSWVPRLVLRSARRGNIS